MNTIGLVCGTFICLFLIYKIKKEKIETNVAKTFVTTLKLLAMWASTLVLQLVGGVALNLPIPLIYYDYLTYIAACFTPVYIVILSIQLISDKPVDKIKKYLIIVPIISLLVLWTNDFHHLFYQVYSVNFEEAVYGPMFHINAYYSYILIGAHVIIMMIGAIRKSGFISKSAILISVGSLVPVIVNVLGILEIISISIYITPICFVVAVFCYYTAIFKYKALHITPIALKTITNTMSDAYVIISNDGIIGDYNRAFDKLFGSYISESKDDSIFELLQIYETIDQERLKKAIKLATSKNKIVTEEYHLKRENIDKYFEIDIKAIKGKYTKENIAILLLLKDITQHKHDIETIEAKQEVIVKQGQLVSIGELAGGVAHDINTPISAIKTGLTLMEELNEPRDENEKQLRIRMNNCADKIIKIVNSMRNQIRNLGSEEKINFKISDILSDVKIIAYNELQKNRCDLQLNILDDLSVNGSPTKLSQVFTNLIINAMQSYDEKGGKIIVNVRRAPDKYVLIEITDYAGGIPEEIRQSVFKNILTTKGTKGTGLGLYLAYSVIKGEFDGDISFESDAGIGTTFYIKLKQI